MATDFEITVLKELSDIKATGAATAASAAALNERLFNEGSGVITVIKADINAINDEREEEKKITKTKDYIHYSLPPVLVTVHAILRHLGLNI